MMISVLAEGKYAKSVVVWSMLLVMQMCLVLMGQPQGPAAPHRHGARRISPLERPAETLRWKESKSPEKEQIHLTGACLTRKASEHGPYSQYHVSEASRLSPRNADNDQDRFNCLYLKIRQWSSNLENLGGRLTSWGFFCLFVFLVSINTTILEAKPIFLASFLLRLQMLVYSFPH